MRLRGFLLWALIVAGLSARALSAEAGPTANFQADPRLGEVPLVVHFNNTSSGDGPLAFHWEFGDGQQSSERDPAPHAYGAPGTFEVTLTVTDSSGVPDRKSVAITVDGPTLVAALLPVSRSVPVGATATAFATVINAGRVPAIGVKIQLDNATGPGGGPLPAAFSFQTTDPATNAVTGTPNTPVDLPPGKGQTFVIAVTPSVALAPTDVRFDIEATNTTRDARTVTGLNTLLLSASVNATPDVVALAVTTSGDGILTLAGSARVGAFSVATVNVGAGGPITASADTGAAALPVGLSLCRTTPGTGLCESPIAPTVETDIAQGATPTFAVFATASAPILYDPEVNRIFVRFKDASGATRGATSVAVKGP